MVSLCDFILILGTGLFQILIDFFYFVCSFICTLGHYPYSIFYLVFIYLFSLVFFSSVFIHMMFIIQFGKGKSSINYFKKILLYIFLLKSIFLGIIIINDLLTYVFHHNDIIYRIEGKIYFAFEFVFNYIFFIFHFLFSSLLLWRSSKVTMFNDTSNEKISEMAVLGNNEENNNVNLSPYNEVFNFFKEVNKYKAI